MRILRCRLYVHQSVPSPRVPDKKVPLWLDFSLLRQPVSSQLVQVVLDLVPGGVDRHERENFGSCVPYICSATARLTPLPAATKNGGNTRGLAMKFICLQWHKRGGFHRDIRLI